MTRVAFQGEPGAYSEEAVRRLYGEGAEPVPCRDFAAVGRAVAEGAVEVGLLPVENSLAGSVAGSHDVLAAGGLEVVGEVVTPIHHCVLGVPGAELEGLARVLSHPVALAQCTRFLRARPGVEPVAVHDTAGAAREVAERAHRAEGAIAGRGAAERYGLAVLAAGVEDRPDNQTRFLAVARAGRGGPAPPDAAAAPERKSSLLVEPANRPGALARVLLPFSERGIDLSRLECRPTGEPWRYRFFLDVEADARSPGMEEALREAGAHAEVRLLGCYPRWGRAAADAPRERSVQNGPRQAHLRGDTVSGGERDGGLRS